MKVVVQRSLNSSVAINKNVVGSIEHGLVVLVGFTLGDTSRDIDYLVDKIIHLRIFDDENGVMNKSIMEVGGEILSISQFTLEATTKNGNRPSYINAMKGDNALKYYNLFNSKLNEKINTYPGVFGADMKLSILNDGPITIIIDSKNK